MINEVKFSIVNVECSTNI